MTRSITLPSIVVMILFFYGQARSQSFEVQQLLLDYRKLTQEKQILSDLYKGYEILSSGYGAIRDASRSSFDLHNAFLTGLLRASPTVRNYHRIADILNLQAQISTGYKTAWAKYRQDPHLSPDEIAVIGNSLAGLLDLTVKNVESLTTILTDGLIRAGDGERLRRIDQLHQGMQSHWVFLQSFIDQVAILSAERAADEYNHTRLRALYGLSN